MGHITFKTQFFLAFGVAIAVVAWLGTVSYRRALKEEADQKWVAHTHQVLEELDAILTSLLEQETSQRGYGLTRNPSFLEHSEASRNELQQHLANLRKLTSDNPKQGENLNRLGPLVAARLALLTEISNRNEPRDAVVQGKQLMDQTGGVILEMKKEEQELLARRLEAAAKSSRRMKTVLIAGTAVAVALLFAAGFVIQREISRRNRAERELKTAEERYHRLFDRNPLPVWVYDRESLSFLDVNTAAIADYGYSREEFLSLKITDIRPPEEIRALLESAHHAPDRAETSGPWKHRKKSGELIEVEISSYPLVFEGREARLVVSIDITERKRAEEELRRSEERFRLIVSNVSDYAILMLDPEGRVVSWNEGAERIKGYRADEIVGQHFSRFYPAEDVQSRKPEFELEQAVKLGRFEDEGWRVRKDGSRFWANVIVTALRDGTGCLRGFGKVTRDITERKRAEEEILRRTWELEAANNELEAFSYSVSHDLRAPLRAIDGFSQALQEDYGERFDGTGQDYLRRVRAATQRMGTLIDDLLNLSRVTRAEMRRERVDMSQLANAIGSELRTAHPEREVEFVVSQGLHAEGDSRLMRVVLENLISNSWKFTSKRERAQIELGTVQTNGAKAFFVRDNGAGFDQRHADRLFGAFQRLHGMNEFPGTGIGLATVKRIIHRHGGRVWAEGAVNQGATIYFTI